MAYDGTLKFDTSIDISKFQSGINKISSIAGAGLKATAAIITGVGTAILGMGTAATKAGMDFEAGMSNVAAISGATGEELESLTEMAKEMGAKTKFSATESAEAFSYMAMAGWETADMLDGIEGIMNLAAASGEDLATTSDIVTDALTAFGLKAEDSSHFADVLAAASSNANTNVGLMGETFKYVAPVAGALGFSAEDTATAIGLMANAGIKGSQAGTALRSIMSRMAKPTDEVASAMEALGISLTNSDGSMKSLNKIMGDLRNGFDGLSESESAQMAAALGGQEAMSGLLAIVNASEEDYNKLQAAINGATDELTGYSAAAEMAETMNDNLQGQVTILKSGLEGLGISFYEDMQGPMKDIVKTAQEMVEQLQAAYNADGLSGIVSAAGDILAQLVQKIAGAAPSLIEAAVSLVGSFCDGLKKQNGIPEAGAKLITTLISALFECTGDIGTTAIALLGQLAGGLAEGAPQIIQAAEDCISNIVDAVVEWGPTIMGAGAQIIGSLIQGLISSTPQIFDTGIELLNNLAQGIQDTLPDLIPVAMQVLMNFSDTLRENVGDLVDAGLNLIMTLAQSLIDNIPVFIETIPTIVTNIAGIINDNAPKLLASGIELIAKLAMGLIRAIPTIVQNIPQIIQAIVSAFTAFNWLNLGATIITTIKNGVVSLAKSLPQALKNIGETAKDWIRAIDWHTLGADIIDLIQIGIKSLLTAIPNLLKSIGTTAVEFFKNIDWVDLGANLIKGLISGITGALDGLWSAVTNLCSNLVDSVKNFFGIHSPSTVMEEQGDYLVQGMINGLAALPGKAAKCFTDTLDKLLSWGADMGSEALVIASTVLSNITDYFGQMPGRIASTLSNVASRVVNFGSSLVSNFRDIGSNVINGLIGGIGSMVSGLYDSIKGALSGLVSKAKSALGISSPSKVFAEEIGEWIPPGIGKGVEKEMPRLEKGMEYDLVDMAGRMKAAVSLETGKTSQKMASGSHSAASDVLVSSQVESLKEDIQGLADHIDGIEIRIPVEGKVYLDKREAGSILAPEINRKLGDFQRNDERGGA